MPRPSNGDSQIDAVQFVLDKTDEALSKYDPTKNATEPRWDVPGEVDPT